jgi:hypothetical protein
MKYKKKLANLKARIANWETNPIIRSDVKAYKKPGSQKSK